MPDTIDVPSAPPNPTVKRPSLARGAAANVAGRAWLIVVNLASVPLAFAQVALGFLIPTAAALFAARQAAASARQLLASRFARRPVVRA